MTQRYPSKLRIDLPFDTLDPGRGGLTCNSVATQVVRDMEPIESATVVRQPASRGASA